MTSLQRQSFRTRISDVEERRPLTGNARTVSCRCAADNRNRRQWPQGSRDQAALERLEALRRVDEPDSVGVPDGVRRFPGRLKHTGQDEPARLPNGRARGDRGGPASVQEQRWLAVGRAAGLPSSHVSADDGLHLVWDRNGAVLLPFPCTRNVTLSCASAT